MLRFMESPFSRKAVVVPCCMATRPTLIEARRIAGIKQVVMHAENNAQSKFRKHVIMLKPFFQH